jgi:hypothetical protein
VVVEDKEVELVVEEGADKAVDKI